MQRPSSTSTNPPLGPARLGVMGGSFDPIHLGHLIMAEAAREALNLNLVLFVPTAVQPLKQDCPATAPQHRAAMIELAIEGNSCFRLSRVDLDRPGPSYTVDTLRLLHEEYAHASFWFVLGADALQSLPRWRDPQGILALTRLAVVRRPDAALDLADLIRVFPRLDEAVDWVDAPLIRSEERRVGKECRLRGSPDC